jgi:hypothetical protein
VASSVLAPPPKSLTAERERALLEEWKKRTVRA